MSHDEAVDLCFASFKPEHKDKFARQFVAGLRSGLSAFAMMQSMPGHRFRPNRAGCREVCACFEAKESLASLQKAIRTIAGLKLSVDQARGLVETLGFCGILQTDRHRGYLERWTNPGLSPNRPSSDRAYPVDFWKGKDGVNDTAIDFWFGSIPSQETRQ